MYATILGEFWLLIYLGFSFNSENLPLTSLEFSDFNFFVSLQFVHSSSPSPPPQRLDGTDRRSTHQLVSLAAAF
ncbi:unnamed protein product [Citrullus colocynthis]|uniref:Uncharacterized protein n=1 Tax=Citrullus colocynthis TaxID=252529 RepID=A0ABP0YV78_9ROSI